MIFGIVNVIVVVVTVGFTWPGVTFAFVVGLLISGGIDGYKV